MTITYIKKVPKTAQTGSEETSATVTQMLETLKQGGEDSVKQYCSDFDGWNGEIIVSQSTIENAIKRLPETVKDDIRFAYQRMSREAAHKVAPVASRISRYEGMEGHAMTGDV